MRCARVGVPIACCVQAMVSWIRIGSRVETGKRIHPRARTESTLTIIQAGRVRIGASRAKMRAADTVAAVATIVVSQRRESVLEPGLADLLKLIVVVGAATH